MSMIVKLGAGERHTFALSALRLQLTGTTADVATLRAVDQAGGESVDVRLSPLEVVMTPQPRRLRIVAVPTAGGSFPAGTAIGLTLFTEGASSARAQVLVTPSDSGALKMHELGVLEFATDRSVLTASGSARSRPQDAAVDQPLVSSTIYDRRASAPDGAARQNDRSRDDAWLQAGRYALRDARQLGSLSDAPSTAWSVVIDGSISMLRLEASGALAELLELTCGTFVSWTDTWPNSCLLTGSTTGEVREATTAPEEVCRALRQAQPWSTGMLAGGVETAIRAIGSRGAVLVISDGVPSDVDALVDLAEKYSDRYIRFVATGLSSWGLSVDQVGRARWQEELAGFDVLGSLPNVSVVAVRIRADDTLVLEGTRAAELALRITGQAVSA